MVLVRISTRAARLQLGNHPQACLEILGGGQLLFLLPAVCRLLGALRGGRGSGLLFGFGLGKGFRLKEEEEGGGMRLGHGGGREGGREVVEGRRTFIFFLSALLLMGSPPLVVASSAMLAVVVVAYVWDVGVGRWGRWWGISAHKRFSFQGQSEIGALVVLKLVLLVPMT